MIKRETRDDGIALNSTIIFYGLFVHEIRVFSFHPGQRWARTGKRHRTNKTQAN
jgi:hypothetical protein